MDHLARREASLIRVAAFDIGKLDDVIHGRAGSDVIRGGRDDDHLYGDEGNDTLYGGSGDDVLVGAGGNDTYGVDNAGDVVELVLDGALALLHLDELRLHLLDALRYVLSTGP